jgi:hypothetical protein
MALRTRKRLILTKAETTYGTDAVPTSTDALLVRTLEITPLLADVKSRDLVRPYLGNYEVLLAQTRVQVKFDVEIQGSGTAGTAPKFGAVLKACGLSETITAATSVAYSPVSTSFSSATIYYYVDGVFHKLTGCRGTVDMVCKVGEIPYFTFDMIGLYNSPSDVALPSASYNQAAPLIFKNGNTSNFSVFSYSGALESIDLKLANDIQYRELVGGTKEAMLVDRKPSGTFSIEAVNIGTKDFFSAAINTPTGAMSFQHGTTAGSIFTFNSPQTDLSAPTYVDMNGVQMLQVPYMATPTTAGNDEFSFSFT